MAQSVPTSSLGFQDFFSTTLSGAITSTDTTISLASAPTPTEGFLVIEPDSSTNREIIMYTSVSSNDVICGSVDDRGIGGTTARAHSSGAIVKMNTVSDMFEALQSGRGLSSSFVLPDGAVKPNDLLASASSLNTWAWDSWTPTLSGQFTDGDWTKACKYIKKGKTVLFHLYLTAADATPMAGGAGSATFTLPVTSASLGAANRPEIGTGWCVDDNGNSFPSICIWASTTTANINVNNAASTYLLTAGITSTVPFTWTTSDVISIRGFYEAA